MYHSTGGLTSWQAPTCVYGIFNVFIHIYEKSVKDH